ncbi:MAG: transposase [Candidatus Thiodiazotropha sp.]
MGLSALKYLSRYLYRGVIGESNIVSNNNGNVTFKYVESRTGRVSQDVAAFSRYVYGGVR